MMPDIKHDNIINGLIWKSERVNVLHLVNAWISEQVFCDSIRDEVFDNSDSEPISTILCSALPTCIRLRMSP
jgi:hypothetical protein